jgi:hypothetical protein
MQTATMKRERDNFKLKIRQLMRKLKDENDLNDKQYKFKAGNYVEYGAEIQLLHVDSGCFVQGQKVCAEDDNGCYKVDLATQGSPFVYFQVLGGFKYKKEGDKVHYNDQIILKHTETNMYLHSSERLLKIENYEGKMGTIQSGINIITPKKIDRRHAPNQYVPHFEINVAS